MCPFLTIDTLLFVNVMMSRKDVKDNSQGFGKRQPRCCTDRLRNDATAEVMDICLVTCEMPCQTNSFLKMDSTYSKRILDRPTSPPALLPCCCMKAR